MNWYNVQVGVPRDISPVAAAESTAASGEPVTHRPRFSQSIWAKMGKKNTGVNTKVAAAKERQAQIEGARSAKARAAEEAAEAREWSKGSNQRGSKREDESARKQEEKEAKIAAKKALEQAEAKELTGLKSVVVSKKTASASWFEMRLELNLCCYALLHYTGHEIY